MLEKIDLPVVASIHLRAFPESALTQLGFEATRLYYEWQLTGPHNHTALAAVNGVPILGFCIGGVSRGALSGFLRKNRGYLVWHIAKHPWLVSNPIVKDRLKLALRVLRGKSSNKTLNATARVLEKPSFGILAIAVIPDQQRSGIGKQLMAEMERIAREQYYTQLNLTVAPDNISAITFYEKNGWIRVCENDGGPWRGTMIKRMD
jgi:ribosomal protein S18 acetylase RimI-like enzyme